MEQTMSDRALEVRRRAREEAARDFLSGYQLCLDMLHLRKYERRRAKEFEEPEGCEDVLNGNEAYWKARIYEVQALISSMKNGREKIILYSHFLRGESVERAADLLGVSRRTGYRIYHKGLYIAGTLLEKSKKAEPSFPEFE